METLGGAAAVIAIVQTAFSLASALNTYASGVQEAGDDILSLASEIDSTFGQLRDLGNLIEKNDKTHAWSEDGLKNAQKCVGDCERILKKLRKLLQKSTVSVTSDEVGSGDIDVTKFERFLWPRYKPRLNVWRQELRSVKQDILIAYSTYMTQAGATRADRQRALHDLPRIERTRKLIQSQVQEERENLRQAKSRHRMKFDTGSTRRSSVKSYDAYHGTQRARPKDSPSDDGLLNEALDRIIYDREEDLVLDFEDWAANIEQQNKQEEEERKRIEEEALEKWKAKQNEEAEALNQQIWVARTKLREELSRQQMAPQKIEETLDRIHPEPSTSNAFRALDFTLEAGGSTQPAERKGKSKRTRSPAVNSRQERAKKIIPALLQDPSAEGGIAQLEACYFQRAKAPGQKIRHFQVGIPQQWLIESLMMKEKQSRNNPKKLSSIWREFAALPDDYRDAITDVLTNTEKPHSGGDHCWDMIFAECLRKPRYGGFLFRKGDDDVLGVWVVWKKRNHHMPLKLDTLNPYSDAPDATKPLVQTNDHTQHSVLHDVTNSSRARIIPHSIARVGSRTRTESNHGTREQNREREWKRRERGGKNENHGDIERELEVGLDTSNSSWTMPYYPRMRSVKTDRRRRRNTFHRGEPPWEPYLDSESDFDERLTPRTARRAHRGGDNIDRGYKSPDEIIIRPSRDRSQRRRDSSRPRKSHREPDPDFDYDWRTVSPPRTTYPTDLPDEIVDQGFTLPNDAAFRPSKDRRKGRQSSSRPRKQTWEPDPDFRSDWTAVSHQKITRRADRVGEIVNLGFTSPNDATSSLPRYPRDGRGQHKWSLDYHEPVVQVSRTRSISPVVHVSRIRSISPVESYAGRRRMRGLESENSSEEDGSNTQYLQDDRKETDEVVTKRLLRSYTNPDANIPVIEELGHRPQPAGMHQDFITVYEEPSESSIPTRGDNGDTAAKTEERNQLAGADSSKESFSADTPAGLETAKHVRLKAEVDVIPDRAVY